MPIVQSDCSLEVARLKFDIDDIGENVSVAKVCCRDPMIPMLPFLNSVQEDLFYPIGEFPSSFVLSSRERLSLGVPSSKGVRQGQFRFWGERERACVRSIGWQTSHDRH